MCMDWFYKKKYGIDKPKNTINIDDDTVVALLQTSLTNPDHPLGVMARDWKYKLAPKTEYMRMIRYDNTDTISYESDYMDCDDFAAKLHGAFCIPGWSSLVFGEVTCFTGSDCHRINCFIDSDYQVWLVEPQNDMVWKPGARGWEYYSVDLS